MPTQVVTVAISGNGQVMKMTIDKMPLLKIEQYPEEMQRVRRIIATAKSEKLKNDYVHYLLRLAQEKREYYKLYGKER